jgi:hypothetical protein
MEFLLQFRSKSSPRRRIKTKTRRRNLRRRKQRSRFASILRIGAVFVLFLAYMKPAKKIPYDLVVYDSISEFAAFAQVGCDL